MNSLETQKPFLSAVLFSLLVGCASSSPDLIASVATMPDDQLQQQHVDILCRAYGRGQYENVRSELIRRGALTAEEWKLIAQHRIRTGMSECALMASWARSGVHITRSRSMLSNETVTHWTFQECADCKAHHVTTLDGKIVHWEE